MAKIEELVMKNVMKADLYQDMKTVLSNISRKVKILGDRQCIAFYVLTFYDSVNCKLLHLNLSHRLLQKFDIDALV